MTDIPLHQHWHDIYLRRWLILLTGASAALAAYVFSAMVSPVYEAKTTFYLATNAAPLSYVGPVPDAPFGPLFPTPEKKAAALNVGILRGREVRATLAEKFDMPLSEIKKRVAVTVSGDFMIDLFVRNPDPEKAARIANAVPGIYADFHERSMRSRATNEAKALLARIITLEAARRARQDAIEAARKASGSTADQGALGQRQADVDREHRTAENLTGQIEQTEARIASLKNALAREAGYYARDSAIITTSTLDALQTRSLQLRVDLAAITDGPSSPRRAAIEGQIAEIEGAMARERARIATAKAKPSGSLYENLRLELTQATAMAAGLRAARKAAQARLVAASGRFDALIDTVTASDQANTELGRLDRQIASTEENLASARLQAKHASAPIVVVAQAVAPTRPVFPLPILNTIVAAVVGLVLGAYYALFVAHSERSAQIRRSARAAPPLFTPEEIAQLRKTRRLDLSDTYRVAGDG